MRINYRQGWREKNQAAKLRRGAAKPFLVNLYLKTERCILLKLPV